MTTQPTDTKRLRDLLAKATPGEWRGAWVTKRCLKEHQHGEGDCDYNMEVTWHDDDDGHSITSIDTTEVAGNFDWQDGGIIKKEDRDLIVAAKNALPGLLDEVERYKQLFLQMNNDWLKDKEELERLRNDNDRLRTRTAHEEWEAMDGN